MQYVFNIQLIIRNELRHDACGNPFSVSDLLINYKEYFVLRLGVSFSREAIALSGGYCLYALNCVPF